MVLCQIVALVMVKSKWSFIRFASTLKKLEPRLKFVTTSTIMTTTTTPPPRLTTTPEWWQYLDFFSLKNSRAKNTLFICSPDLRIHELTHSDVCMIQHQFIDVGARIDPQHGTKVSEIHLGRHLTGLVPYLSIKVIWLVRTEYSATWLVIYDHRTFHIVKT